MAPKVTVLMAVYNGELFLRAAIDSVLSQTFTDFEFIIYDDASTDSTPEILRSTQDARLRVIRNPENVGQRVSAQRGLQIACGEYIARLDADDLCRRTRLEKKVAYLDAHPEIAVVGSACEFVDKDGRVLKASYPPSQPLLVEWHTHFTNVILNSTVLYRREAVTAIGGYRPEAFAEDYDLWSRMLRAKAGLAQLDEVLAQIRQHERQVSRVTRERMVSSAVGIVCENIQSLLGYAVDRDVAACLYGAPLSEPVPPEMLSKSIRVLDESLKVFTHRRAGDQSSRHMLLSGSLRNLYRLARMSGSSRIQPFRVALAYGLRYTPGTLFTSRFLRFAARVLLPAAQDRLREPSRRDEFYDQ